MYDQHSSRRDSARRPVLFSFAVSALVIVLGARTASAQATAQVVDPNSVIRKISDLSNKLELTTNTSRILTLEKNIPRVQVNNPELLAVTPLSANQVQISAKKAGVTQVNLWDEDGDIHTVDVMIYGDARELQVALQTQFPHTSIKVFRYSESLVLTGYVDRPDQISPIMALAQDYAPKVINNINVGGVQQVLLKVKVMEVSRTKLRQLGVDWGYLGGNGGFVLNSVSDILSFDGIGDVVTNNNDTISFGVINGNNAFFGFLQALQQNRIARILAEPNITAVSGRPAQFNVGGEFPVLVPQSLGTTSIEYKPYGTQVDFLPIVLGNGNIRLEVRPRISEIDPARSVELNGFDIPALTVRQVDTAVEMKAGQTFALAGLVQERNEGVKRGLPYVSDVPVVGVPFRRTEDEINEIELLILVTPEFVDAVDACEMPCGGPGTFTVAPTNSQLFCAGHVEVPAHCNPTQGLGACGQDPCGCCNGGCNGGCSNCGNGQAMNGGRMPALHGEVILPGGTGYDDPPGAPTTITDQPQSGPSPASAAPPSTPPSESAPATLPTPPQAGAQAVPEDITLPVVETNQAPAPQSDAAQIPGGNPPSAAVPGQGPDPNTSGFNQLPSPFGPSSQNAAQRSGPVSVRPYSPDRQPVFMRNATRSYNPQSPNGQSAIPTGQGGLIGPVGYDVE